MDAQQAKAYFKQSDDLYRQGRHGEALAVLETLNEQFPNQKNILHPMALALAELGRNEEALLLCDQVIQLFDAPKAHALKAKLLQAQHPAGMDMVNMPPMDDLDQVLDRPAYMPPPPEKPEIPWLKYSLIGGGIVLLILLLALPIIFNDPSARPAVPEEEEVIYVLHPVARFLIILFIAFSLNFLLTYFVLGIMGKHKYDTPMENVTQSSHSDSYYVLRRH